jgi:hypothetical protein
MVDSINTYVINGFVVYPDELPQFDNTSKPEEDAYFHENIDIICTEIVNDVYQHTDIELETHINNCCNEPLLSSIYIGVCKSRDSGVGDPYTNRIYSVSKMLEMKLTKQEEVALDLLREHLKLGHDYVSDIYCITSVCNGG